MSIASDISKLLRGVQAITSAVPKKTVGIYAVSIPQRVPETNAKVGPPLILVTTLKTDYHNTIEPAASPVSGTKTAELDIDCKGMTENEAGLIHDAVADFFQDYVGATGGNSIIEAVGLEDGGDSTEQPEQGQGSPIIVKTLSANVIFI